MRTIIFSSLFLSFLVFACATSRKAPYELPDAMLPEVKVEYAKNCEKGYELYKLSCAKCHSSKKRGREIIPDFSSDQLRGYALRISNARHESNLPDSLISEEELMHVMTFLSYKKKN